MKPTPLVELVESPLALERHADAVRARLFRTASALAARRPQLAKIPRTMKKAAKVTATVLVIGSLGLVFAAGWAVARLWSRHERADWRKTARLLLP